MQMVSVQTVKEARGQIKMWDKLISQKRSVQAEALLSL